MPARILRTRRVERMFRRRRDIAIAARQKTWPAKPGRRSDMYRPSARFRKEASASAKVWTKARGTVSVFRSGSSANSRPAGKAKALRAADFAFERNQPRQKRKAVVQT